MSNGQSLLKRIAQRIVRLVVLTLALLVATGGTARAAVCGDANLDGVVNHTDAVLVLRAAAGLSSMATNPTSDLDVDGALTDTDVVRILRIAQNLSGAPTCTSSQREGAANRVSSILRIGAAAIPSGARIAQSTIPCADGGFIQNTGTGQEHFDCSEDSLVTNGTIVFDDNPQNSIFRDTYQGFSFFDLTTFENLLVDGTLAYDTSAGDRTTVTGTLASSSNLLGTFIDEYFEITVDSNVHLIGADVRTEVTSGLGGFANLREVRYVLLESGVEDLRVVFTNGNVDHTIDGDGICNRCSSSQECSEDMFCFPCVDNCSGTPSVCSVDFAYLNCGPPGVFGPPALCEPCTSNGQCGSVLNCYECDHECTGNTDRCSSNVLFVECIDGYF